MGDLGDLSSFLKDGSGVVNLDWLDVDEQEYRDQERLPQQNLQIGPDLAALWSHEDKPSIAYLEPNQSDAPRTMGDLSQAHGPLRAAPEDIVRALRYAMMQTTDAGRIRDALIQRFDSESLRAASSVVAEHLGERGLLGRLYVDAEDFPTCQSGKGLVLAHKHTGEALFVKAKVACGDCIHAKTSPNGGTNCAQFHKQIVLEIPYTPELADKVEGLQRAKGRMVIQASEGNPRDRIRLALLAPSLATVIPVGQPKPVENTTRLLASTEPVSPVVIPVDLTRQKEATRIAVEEAFRTQRISVQETQQAYKLIATAQTEIELDRIRLAASEVQGETKPVYRGAGEQGLPAKATPAQADAGLAKAADAATQAQDAATKLAAQRRADPIISLLRREMLKGRGFSELVTALRLAFDVRDLAETKPLWEPTIHEAGLFGVVYASQESFGDCREGADFLARHNPGVRVMVAGAKCSGCIYNKIGRCLLYGKPLARSTADVLTQETVAAVIQEHKAAGRLDPCFSQSPGDPVNLLRSIHTAVESRRTMSAQTSRRPNIEKAFRGSDVQMVTSGLTKRAVVEAAQRYLNEGLYGTQLLEAMRARFDPRDLVAAKSDLRAVLAEQGLQGIYYVDPSIYSDYGHGCDEAMRLHRSRLVPAVKIGVKCASCTLQTKPGYCSKLNKPLVTEPNYVDKAAQQREILASGPATDISYANLVNNGHSMVQEFEMGQREATVEIDAPIKPVDVTVEFGNQGIKL
jgi:hypothetical protein